MGQLRAYFPARLLWSTSGSWEPWIGNILAGGEKTLYFDGEQTLSTKPALKLTYLENTYLLWIFHFWWRRSNLWQHYRHIFRDHLLRVFHFWDLPDGEGEGQHHLLISSLLVWWMVDWLIDWYKYDGLLVKNWIVLMISKFSSRFVCGFTKKYIPTFQMCGKKSRKSFCTLTMKYLNAKGAIVRFISKLCKLNWILKRSHKVYGINQIKHCHHWPFLLKWW